MAVSGRDTGLDREIPWRTRIAQALVRARSDVSFAVVDAVVIVVGYSAALVLRFIDVQGVPSNWLLSFALVMPIVVALHLLANLAFGAYGHVWEYASIEEAMRLVFATVVAGGTIVLGIIAFREISGQPGVMPLTVAAAGALVSLGGMGMLRFRSRLFSFKRTEGLVEPVRTLVVGTGHKAANLARRGPVGETLRDVIGFVGVNDSSDVRHLAGREVLGVLDDIAQLVVAHQADEVVVAANLSERQLRGLVDSCMNIEVRLRILPDLDETPNGSSYLGDIRDLQLEDLLPRPSVAHDLAGAAGLLEGRRVLVTGAGGSIGSEIGRQLLDMGATVVALDHDETHLHDAMLGWPESDHATPVLCDIRDESDVEKVFAETRPEVVFHTAALKHVPILESYPVQAVKTNVFGTVNVLNASRMFDLSRFVLISTDKAVNPEGVLGSTKRVAEMLVQSASATSSSTRFAVVRFGNVLGSRGSVVPTFIGQIRRGGPVTITDPEMTRYFMTVEEAVGLVLQAGAMADEGEVFVLDMGEPARIEDLAHRMIRLAGLVPGRDIAVVTTGPRPGEKTSEILSNEPLRPSAHPKIRLAGPGYPGPATMREILETFDQDIRTGDIESLRRNLEEVCWQDWQPNETVDLVALEELVT